MNYISTRNNQKNFTFKDVFLKGLADDGGLFVPKSIKPFKEEELVNLKNLSYNDLAAEIIYPFIGDFIPKDDLISLISKSYSNFRSDDVVKISDLGDLKVLELFHGPTLAFKDIAMQLIGNFYQYHLGRDQKKIKSTATWQSFSVRLTWSILNVVSEESCPGCRFPYQRHSKKKNRYAPHQF